MVPWGKNVDKNFFPVLYLPIYIYVDLTATFLKLKCDSDIFS